MGLLQSPFSGPTERKMKDGTDDQTGITFWADTGQDYDSW
jgi:hypothetical protein